MPTLQNITDKAHIISQLAKAFGYRNVRIFCDQKESKILQLIVQSDPDYEEDRFETAFVTTLMEVLNCQVSVLNESQIKFLYKAKVLEQSAPVNNPQKIAELFHGDLNFVIKEIDPNDEKTKVYLSQGRELAKPILQKLGSGQSLLFSSTALNSAEFPAKNETMDKMTVIETERFSTP